MKFTFTILFSLIIFNIFAQNISISTDGTQPNASAMLEVQSITQGFAPPRMSQYEMLNISNPAAGLIVYNTTNQCLYYFDDSNWTDFQFCDCGHVVDVEGNFYRTVRIGEQCWMAENLRTTKYANGTSITGVYDNGATYLANYGKVYTWAAVMNGASSSNSNPSGVQGVCPNGWHIPSESEWQELKTELNDATNDGRMLKKYDNLWLNNSTDPNAGYNDGNQTGFDALPGGYWYTDGAFHMIGTIGYFWSSREQPVNDAFLANLIYNQSTLNIAAGSKNLAISVRCIRD